MDRLDGGLESFTRIGYLMDGVGVGTREGLTDG